MKIITLLTAMVAVSLSQFSMADDVTRADSHAPIGVMADHFHKKGRMDVLLSFHDDVDGGQSRRY